MTMISHTSIDTTISYRLSLPPHLPLLLVLLLSSMIPSFLINLGGQVVADATSVIDRVLYHNRHIRGHVEHHLAAKRSGLFKEREEC